MNNEQRAHKQAAEASKNFADGVHFVVYVFDQGYDVFTAAQAQTYGPLIHIEATYVGGVQVSQKVAA